MTLGVTTASRTAGACLFCEHKNPDAAKFCNECGSPLHLKPCIRCSGINDASAAHCHSCGMAFHVPLVSTEAVSPRVPSTSGMHRLLTVVTPREARPGRRLAATASVLVAGAVAAVGYPLFEPARLPLGAQTSEIESMSTTGDAALRAPSTPTVNASDTGDATAADTAATAGEAPSAPPSELTQRDMTTPADPIVAASGPAESSATTAATPSASAATTSKRGASKSKSTNRGATRRTNRTKGSAKSSR